VSRSHKGQKWPGFEYWGKRPGNKNGGLPGRITKQLTHRKERQEAKRSTRKERDE
jgi:hypothetical protein